MAEEPVVIPIDTPFSEDPSRLWRKHQDAAMAAAFRAGKSFEQAQKDAEKAGVKALKAVAAEKARLAKKDAADEDAAIRKKQRDQISADKAAKREAAREAKKLSAEMADAAKRVAKERAEADKRAIQASRDEEKRAHKERLQMQSQEFQQKQQRQRQFARDMENMRREMVRAEAHEARNAQAQLRKKARDRKDMEQTISRGLRAGAMGAAAGGAMALGAAKSVAESAGLDFSVTGAITRVQKTGLDAASLAAQGAQPGQNLDQLTQQIEQKTREVALLTGTSREVIMDALVKHVDETGKLAEGLDMLPDIAKRAIAFKQSPEDSAKLMASIVAQHPQGTKEEHLKLFDYLGRQGRAGDIEIKDMKTRAAQIMPLYQNFGVSQKAMDTYGGDAQTSTELLLAGLAQTVKNKTHGTTAGSFDSVQSFGSAMSGPALERFKKKGFHLTQINPETGHEELMPVDKLIPAMLGQADGDMMKLTGLMSNYRAIRVLRAFGPDYNAAAQEAKKKGLSKDEQRRAGMNAVQQSVNMGAFGGNDVNVERDFGFISKSPGMQTARAREDMNQQMDKAAIELVKAVNDHTPEIKKGMELFTSALSTAAEYPKTALAAIFAAPAFASGITSVVISGLSKALAGLLSASGISLAGASGVGAAMAAGGLGGYALGTYYADKFIQPDIDAKDEYSAQLDREYEQEKKRQRVKKQVDGDIAEWKRSGTSGTGTFSMGLDGTMGYDNTGMIDKDAGYSSLPTPQTGFTGDYRQTTRAGQSNVRETLTAEKVAKAIQAQVLQVEIVKSPLETPSNGRRVQ